MTCVCRPVRPALMDAPDSSTPRLDVAKDVTLWTGEAADGAPSPTATGVRLTRAGRYAVLDGRAGASAVWVRDAGGWQLAEHGRPITVSGAEVELYPSVVDMTSRARLWFSGEPIYLPPVRTRVVSASLGTSAGEDEEVLQLHVRKTDSAAFLVFHTSSTAGCVWTADELVIAGDGLSTWEMLESGTLAGGVERVTIAAPQKYEAIVGLRFSAPTKVRVIGGLAP